MSNVSTGRPKIGGGVWVAPVGTALPKNTTEALNEAFESLGHCSEDGVVNSNSPSSENVKYWGGGVAFSMQTERPDEWKFTLIDSKDINVLKNVYGEDNVSGSLSEGITIKVNNSEMAERSYVFDMILSDNAVKRVVIPAARITALEDISYTDSDVIGYGLTISATDDEDGNSHYEYIKG